MKNARLFQIVYKLLSNGKMSATELASDLEVSVRTIYRDIDALSSAGIPIFATRGREGGVELMDHYVIDKDLLSEEEQTSVITSLQAISSIIPSEEDLLEKLNGLWRKEDSSWLHIDLQRWGSSSDNQDFFSLVKYAILNQRVVLIQYLNTNSENIERKVRPVQLLYKGNAWYVYAFCELKEDMRLFKLNRIYKIDLLNTIFTETYELNYQSRDQSSSSESVELKFNESISYRVYDEFEKNQISKLKDGHLLVKADIVIDTWLYGYLLSYLGKVEVVKPDHLRHGLKETLKMMYLKEMN